MLSILFISFIYSLIYFKWYSYCAYLIFFCYFNWKKKSHYIYLIYNHKCTLTRELTLGLGGGSFLHLSGGSSGGLKRPEFKSTKHGVIFEKISISLFIKCLVHFMLPVFILFLFYLFFSLYFFVTVLLLSYFSVINVNLPKHSVIAKKKK